MLKEVAGQPEGTTLLDCIENRDGFGPLPWAYELQRPVAKVAEGYGKPSSRPLQKRDGRFTTSEEEEEEGEEDLPPSLEPLYPDEGPELIPDAELREMFRRTRSRLRTTSRMSRVWPWRFARMALRDRCLSWR
ncbi:unnamed protein product [Symbiodinium necroappetens]|uniref:Uncharacterized protein n=1 Tax=Symbiodinium necroappetens TaxID=1628268 RepID=A0A812UV74_9DINO|nr:unnamed protein product [Symbiodinium necroappetens]